ncbi:MAG: N-acetyltransferase [Clostridia bacterium]|nr:N-acetyltransferase [Clostridia bacterium]
MGGLVPKRVTNHFLNLLFILPEHRGKGYGAGAMTQWEQEMKKLWIPLICVLLLLAHRLCFP